MTGKRSWVLIAAVAAVIAVVAYAAQPRADSPEHSSNSDAANGASAALLFAQAMGHPADQISGGFNLPGSGDLVFVFTPTSAFSADDAQRTLAWVQSGGVLIYASELGDPELDNAFQVARSSNAVLVSSEVGSPVVAGVNQVAGAQALVPIEIAKDQVPILRTDSGSVSGFIQHVGAGTLVVLADPLVLCNAYLSHKDNGRLLADLLGLVGGSAGVDFDEYHHGLVLSQFQLQDWVTTPWGAALVWLLVAVFAGLLLRGRRFGPLLPRPAGAARSDAEWSVAVGRLLRRSSGRARTVGLLAESTERAVAERTGLPLQPRATFWNALRVRAPELASELEAAESTVMSEGASDAELLEVARRLHRVAYPVAESRQRSRHEGRDGGQRA